MSKFSDEAADYDLKLVARTEAAFGVEVDDEEGELVWLPRSQVECDQPRMGQVCSFTVPNWLAEREGLY